MEGQVANQVNKLGSDYVCRSSRYGAFVPRVPVSTGLGFGLCGGRFRPSPGLSVAFFGHRGLDEANAY